MTTAIRLVLAAVCLTVSLAAACPATAIITGCLAGVNLMTLAIDQFEKR